MFRSAFYNSTNGIGSDVTGDKMYINTFRQNMFSGVRLTYRAESELLFAHWQVEVDGTVGKGEDTIGTDDITIWS